MSNLTIQGNSIHGNSSQVDGLPANSNLKYGNGVTVIRMGGDQLLSNAMGTNNLTIVGNNIYGNEKNGIYLGPITSNDIIHDNLIHDNGLAGVKLDLTEAYYGGSSPVNPVYNATSNIQATGNSITGNGAGVQVIGTPTNGFVLNASGNWWGDATGPSNATENPGGLGNAVSGNVDFTPWLNIGTDTSSAVGFQGDFSYLNVSAGSPQAGATGPIQEAINLLADVRSPAATGPSTSWPALIRNPTSSSPSR